MHYNFKQKTIDRKLIQVTEHNYISGKVNRRSVEVRNKKVQLFSGRMEIFTMRPYQKVFSLQYKLEQKSKQHWKWQIENPSRTSLHC